MSFADELRNNEAMAVREKVKKEAWTKKELKIIIDYLKGEATKANMAGKHSVEGYLGYQEYDQSVWHLFPKAEKRTTAIGVERQICRNSIYSDINGLKNEIEKGLKELGFNARVILVDVPIYVTKPQFFGNGWRYVKNGSEKTLSIEYSW